VKRNLKTNSTMPHSTEPVKKYESEPFYITVPASMLVTTVFQNSCSITIWYHVCFSTQN